MKGSAVCEKLFLRKEGLEEYILSEVQGRLDRLLDGDGKVLLEQFIGEKLAAQGNDPRRETEAIRARLSEIRQKANLLMDSLTPETRDLVNDRLRDLAAEKGRLQARVEAMEAVPDEPIDPDAILRDGLTALANLPRVMASGSLEERKEFIHAFLAGITVHPDENRMDIAMRRLPATVLSQGNSCVGMVAGAGFEQVQIERIALNDQSWMVRRAA